MDLSVIVVSYNTKELLANCLESLKEQKRKTELEVIVIDNASPDGSATLVKEKFPWVKLVINEKNLGFATAVNQGVRESSGENIFLLNSDTRFKKGALKALLDFTAEIGPAIIGARLINPDGTVQSSVFRLPTLKGAVLEYWLGKKDYFSKYVPSGNESQEVEAVSGGAMLISREIIEKIGFLDERYFMYFEDLDYCRRAREAGFKVFYLPTAEIVHEHGASGRGLVSTENQWRRLIPSSKIYYGLFKYYLINAIIWSGQKAKKLLS
jgi:GT2 family glycosyltransferase